MPRIYPSPFLLANKEKIEEKREHWIFIFVTSWYLSLPNSQDEMQEPKGSETDTQRWEEGGLNVISCVNFRLFFLNKTYPCGNFSDTSSLKTPKD